MTRYYFHLRDGVDELLDEEGSEFADLAKMRSAVLFNARELMGVGIREGVLDLRFRIDAEDASGKVVFSLGFHDAATIIRPTLGAGN